MKLEISSMPFPADRLMRGTRRTLRRAHETVGRITVARVVLSPILVIILSGCGAMSGPSLRCPDDPVAANAPTRTPDFSPHNNIPKGRVGSIPCPGPLTFFATADPERLGSHSFGSGTLGGQKEADRGIIYTLHGGFIDIAHVRQVMDWTAFYQARFRHALEQGWTCIRLPSREESGFRIGLRYPERWKGLPEPARQRVIAVLSIRLAQRLAITQSVWHEFATGFGYSSTPYPEQPSAFTYDDMTSHLLGAKVAGLALQDSANGFDAPATHYLKRELDRLGAVSPEQTLRALGMVKGSWWKNGTVTRRQFDIGEQGGVIEPMIVPGFPDGRTENGYPFAIPSLRNVAGMDMSGFERVEIVPHMAAWDAMRKLLPGSPDVCRPEEHFPILLRHLRNGG